MSHSAISCNVSLLFKLDFGRKHFGLVGGDYVFKHCQIRGVEVVQAAEVVAAFRQVGTHVYLG